MPLEIHPLALTEAAEITAYYAAIDARLGRQFAVEVERALQQMSAHPLRAAPYRGTSIRRWVLAKFPYCLFYRLRGANQVRVLAVAADRRRPGYWTGRK